MNAPSPSATSPSPGAERDGLALRSSRELGPLPTHTAARAPAPPEDTFVDHFGRALNDSPAWVLLALAALATAGWIVERRRRRELETEKDSVLWADVQPSASSIITHVDELSSEGAPAGNPNSVTSTPMAASTVSRREATLIDLQQLDGRLRRRRARGDLLAATVVLQQHLAEFRFTSPWVFLELREIEHLLDRGQEWELAREAFCTRFGQRAPMWQAPSTADAELARDPLIAQELAAHWPYRDARMVIRHWILGEPESSPAHHAPILALGVYRDLLFLDRLLDRVMISRTEPADSLL
jgi:hypothetical protein